MKKNGVVEELAIATIKMKIMIVAFMVAMVACAHGTMPALRTIDDVATTLCELYAVDNERMLDGVSARDFCAVKENVQPFIDEALAAKQAAGQRVSNGR